MTSMVADPSTRNLSKSRTSTFTKRLRGNSMKTGLIELPGLMSPIDDPEPYYKVNQKKQAREPSPFKVDSKATQINQKDWLLFDFDIEAKPVIEVLSARVLDFAKAEIIAENERLSFEFKKTKRELKRIANLQKLQQLQETKFRLEEEASRRKTQLELAQSLQVNSFKKLFARKLVKDVFLPDMFDKSLESLGSHQLLSDENERILEPIINDSILKVSNILNLKEKSEIFAKNLIQSLQDKLLDMHSYYQRFKFELDLNKSQKLEISQRERQQFLDNKRDLKRKRRIHESLKGILDSIIEQRVSDQIMVKKSSVLREKIVCPSNWEENERVAFGVYLDIFSTVLLLFSQDTSNLDPLKIIQSIFFKRTEFPIPINSQLKDFYSQMIDTPIEKTEEISSQHTLLVDELIETNSYLRFLCEEQIIKRESIHKFFDIIFQLSTQEDSKNSINFSMKEEKFNDFLTNTKYLLRSNKSLNVNPNPGCSKKDIEDLENFERIYTFDGSIREMRQKVFGMMDVEETQTPMGKIGGSIFVFNRSAQYGILKLIFELELNEEQKEFIEKQIENLELKLIEKIRLNNSRLLIFDFYGE